MCDSETDIPYNAARRPSLIAAIEHIADLFF
jgi:hypothetical protein